MIISKQEHKKRMPIAEVFEICNVDTQPDTTTQSDRDLKILTPYGYKNINGFYSSEVLPVYKLELNNGQYVKAAHHHIVKTLAGWKKLKDLTSDDIVEVNRDSTTGFSRVKSITKTDREEVLYDFEVEEVHCFYTNNILSHNSMLLVHLAAEALKQGKNVIYYTLELSEKMVGLRFDAKLTQTALSPMLQDTGGTLRKTVNRKLEKVLETIDKKYNKTPRLIIKEYPTKSASISTLKRHIKSMHNQGYIPDMVVIDYADIMKATKTYGEKRYELESNVEQLRGMAGELQIPVWTASQTNRDGWDKDVVSLNTISESAAKAFVADLIISVGRTEELARENRACYYLAKSRLGPDKIAFTGRFDTSLLDFDIESKGTDSTTMIDNDKPARMASVIRDIMDKNRNQA